MVHWKTYNGDYLILPFFLKLFEFDVVNPVNTVNRAGIDRLLDDVLRIAILPNNPRTPVIWLNIERITSNVGTVLTTDAGYLIDINTLCRKTPPSSGSKPVRSGASLKKAAQFRFQPCPK